jgi:hypothetical protein
VAGLIRYDFYVNRAGYQTIGDGSITNAMTPNNVFSSVTRAPFAPYDGVVVAISATSEDSQAADSLTTISPRIGGTRQSFNVTLASGNTTTYSTTGSFGSMTFSAGDALDIVYGGNTTNAGKGFVASIWTL